MLRFVKCAQVSFFQNVLLRRFNIDAFWIVDRGVGVADADDFDAALVSKREGGDRADISKSLHDGSALFGIDLQHVQSALDQINDAASSSFAAAFSSADCVRPAGGACV